MHQSDLRWIQACVPQSPQGACMPGMCWGQVPSYFHTYNLVPQLLSSPTWNPKHPSWSLSSPDMFKPVSPILPPEPERHDQEKKFRKAPRIPKMDTCHCILSLLSWPMVCMKLTLLGLMAVPHPDPGGQMLHPLGQ